MIKRTIGRWLIDFGSIRSETSLTGRLKEVRHFDSLLIHRPRPAPCCNQASFKNCITSIKLKNIDPFPKDLETTGVLFHVRMFI